MVTTKSYTFSNVTGNHTISAEFSNMTTTVQIVARGTAYGQVRYKINSGSWTTISNLSTATSITVNVNDSITVEATNFTSGYRFKQWEITDLATQDSSTSTNNPYTETGISTNLLIEVLFEAIPSYTITATAGTGGTITPSGTVTVQEGGSQTFQITANTGYVISQILVDGSPIPL